ncbi:unnamed protein product [Phaedon cochleariae]|uniref:Uncharacterized protein n=1 Tax=Phaedon cochleariae TaxID=80249 RepID=A0A9N9X0N6_PHACE|nr:unnamed protein product [Phaedon cochleariae]
MFFKSENPDIGGIPIVLDIADDLITGPDGFINQGDIQSLTQVAENLTTPSCGTDIGVSLQPDFVKTVLNASVDGRAILAAGKQNNILKKAQRKELSRLSIRQMLANDPAYKIQSVTFTRIALQIVSIFSKESASLYCASYLAASKYQKKKNASGVLYEAYISRRRKLRELGVLPRGRSRSSSSTSLRQDSPRPSTSSGPEPEEPGKNNSGIAILLLLPYLLSVPPAIKKQGKQIWKPSRSEVRDAFITQVPTEADILTTSEARKNKYKGLGRSFQPLIVIVGQTLEEANRFHVIVDDKIYNSTSAIGAVDRAFKIFHATGACYPEEATDLWLLIQVAFYKIRTKYDRLSQSIKHLLTDLGQPFE